MLKRDAYSVVSEILKPESFYDPSHQLIYDSIQGLACNKACGCPDGCGGTETAGELDCRGGGLYCRTVGKGSLCCPYRISCPYHCAEIYAREFDRFLFGCVAAGFDETVDVDDLMQETEGRLFEISQRNVKKDVIQINPVIREA
jgi:replicative DNA helicase